MCYNFLGDFMKLEDQFKLLVGGYYGVTYLDEYDLKVYILKDIENYIRDFIDINPIDNFNYVLEAERYYDKSSLKTKLQDALIVLNKINAPIEVSLLVKSRIKLIDDLKKKEKL